MQYDFRGRKVFVAGASSGMGRAVALGAAKGGASVILFARDTDRLDGVAKEARDLGAAQTTVVRGDASDSSKLAEAVRGHEDQFDGVDTMVNSIGMNIVDRAFDDLTRESWSDMMKINLDSAFNLTKFMLPKMRALGSGLIIHIASTAAKKPDLSGAAYQSSKAAVAALTHAVMEEEWQNNIRVTTILPGMTDTPLLDKRPMPVSPEMRAKALQPEDVAHACLFVMNLPARAHVSEIVLQPAQR